jgi:hypothetical protein
MDACNVFSFNPLAPDFLNGIEDPGTPVGFEDVYAEQAQTVTFATATIQTGTLLFPWPFLVRALYSSIDQSAELPAEGAMNLRFLDPDTENSNEGRMRTEICTGIGQAPLPIVPDYFVPQGLSIGWSVQDETDNTTHRTLQFVFVGVRRRAVGGAS